MFTWRYQTVFRIEYTKSCSESHLGEIEDGHPGWLIISSLESNLKGLNVGYTDDCDLRGCFWCFLNIIIMKQHDDNWRIRNDSRCDVFLPPCSVSFFCSLCA